jgi:hypothetical protein
LGFLKRPKVAGKKASKDAAEARERAPSEAPASASDR